MKFPQDIPPDILSRADELLSAKYGPGLIDPELVILVCRGMMEERELSVSGSQIVSLYLAENLPDGGQIWESEDGERHYYPPSLMRRLFNRIAKAIRGTE